MSSTTANDSIDQQQVNRGKLWFGLLGGAFAWLAHLGIAYAIAEFGCLGSLPNFKLGGITLVAWLVLATTAITLLIAMAATISAYRDDRRLVASIKNDAQPPAGARFAARAGWITSGLFSLVILVETLPVFYYLGDC